MSRIQGGKQQNFQVLAEVTFILLLKLQGENPLLRNKKFLNFVWWHTLDNDEMDDDSGWWFVTG